uniref:Uncharacterized protein n=1 Tax=Arundo donax TaxID=35708 RepID=A0A0A9FF16_ARUDO
MKGDFTLRRESLQLQKRSATNMFHNPDPKSLDLHEFLPLKHICTSAVFRK